jgi:DNA-binding response OmpR family regulator
MALKKRILCVDDNEDTCLMMTVVLSQHGYEVTTTTTIAEGLNLAQTEIFNLYILDLWFKDGSGLELCQRIRAFDIVTPIVICSADVYESVQQQALNAGAQAFIPKPTEFDLLIKTIARLI